LRAKCTFKCHNVLVKKLEEIDSLCNMEAPMISYGQVSRQDNGPILKAFPSFP
jgi:hypothetical protein